MLENWMDIDHKQQLEHTVTGTDWELDKISSLVLVSHADGSEIRIYEPSLNGETKMEFSSWGSNRSMPSKKEFFDSLDDAVDYLCEFIRK